MADEEMLFKEPPFDLSKVENLPNEEEMRKWLYCLYKRINPDAWPFYLLGINALYTALGGTSLIVISHEWKEDKNV